MSPRIAVALACAGFVTLVFALASGLEGDAVALLVAATAGTLMAESLRRARRVRSA